MLPGPRHKLPDRQGVRAFSGTFPVFLLQSVESLCVHYMIRTLLSKQRCTLALLHRHKSCVAESLCSKTFTSCSIEQMGCSSSHAALKHGDTGALR